MFHDKHLDRRILKICIYAAVTALITFGIGLAIYNSGPFWSKASSIVGAVMRPVITGIVIAYLMMPLTNAIDRRLTRGRESSPHSSRTRGLSVLLTMAILIGIIAALAFILVITVNKTVRNINLDQFRALGEQLQAQYSELIDGINSLLAQKGITLDSLAPRAMGFVKKGLGIGKVLFFGLIFSIYFLYDGVHIGAYWKNAARAILPDKARSVGRQLLMDADEAFSGYIRGQLIDAVIVGILVSVAMLIARMPFAFIIGLMTGFGNLIPYMGPLFGYGTVVLTSLVGGNVFEHPGKLITGIVILAIIQFIDGNIINPRLLSNQVRDHPLFVIACIIAGGALGGLLGMLLAVPVGAFIKKQFERFLMARERKKASQT